MVLPGWNISEPIDLAYKLYEVVESLRSAPESAKAFASKVSNFRGNLKELRRIIETDIATRSTQDLEHLRATVLACEECVNRCEDYAEQFGKLTKDGKGKMDGAGQAARWTMQEKKWTRMSHEINDQMNSIGLTLQIKSFADGRTRQGSYPVTESLSPPLRSNTCTTLPPYSSPRPDWIPTEAPQHAKTPAEYLGIGSNHKRKSSDSEIPDFLSESDDSLNKGKSASPQSSPSPLRTLKEQDEQSELDSKETIKPLERQGNTLDEIAGSPTGLGISRGFSAGSSAASRIFTSPEISSRRSSTTDITNSASRHTSIITLESSVLEMRMENLSGVQMSYCKEKSRILYKVLTIESFRTKATGVRYIIISPPDSFNIELYFVLPTEGIIPHSEHPQAYGPTVKHKVNFIKPSPLRSQKVSSDRKPSDASSILSPSLTPVSSAASVASSRSLGSPILATNSGMLKEESQRHEYDFRNPEDHRRFQELIMGPDIKLQLQVPIQLITAKKFEKSATKESQLQYLRLWQSGGRQSLMFFANLVSTKYREYRMEYLRPVEKSKTTIRLDVHLPGMVRRRSSGRNPLPIARPSAQQQARLGGNGDENDMSELDYLLIEFSCAQDRIEFLCKAEFYGSPGEPTTSPFGSLSRSPPY